MRFSLRRPLAEMIVLSTALSYFFSLFFWRSAALLAANALKELFLTTLLPDRKLRLFSAQSLSATATDAQLLLWEFEDGLKHFYVDYLGLLEEIMHDSLLHTKSRAVSIAYDLLVAKSEQEAVLLALVVNKLVRAFPLLAFHMTTDFMLSHRAIWSASSPPRWPICSASFSFSIPI